jgi:hypothetical protein
VFLRARHLLFFAWPNATRAQSRRRSRGAGGVPPNTRVQRTRSSPSLRGSPLTRHPLGVAEFSPRQRGLGPT